MTKSERPARKNKAWSKEAVPLVLTAAEAAEFAAALLSPPQPNDALRRAFLSHCKLIAPE